MKGALHRLRRHLFTEVGGPHGFDVTRTVATRSLGFVRQEISCERVMNLGDRFTPRWYLHVFGDDTN